MSSDWPPNPADDGSNDPDLSAIEALLAELDVDDLALDPVPDSVWAGIEERLATEAPDDERVRERSNVVEISQRRRPAAWIMLAAAAAVLVIVPVVIAVLGRGTDTEVLSAAALTYDADAFDPRGAGASAVAELVDHDGRLEIRLVDAELPVVEGEDLQLWLIEPDAAGQPVDVAPVALLGDGAAYQVPDGLDPESHFVVDISIEPRDGDAAHSGKSILRGALQTG